MNNAWHISNLCIRRSKGDGLHAHAERHGLDAVIVATAVKSHYSMAKASLFSGKHTFIEKPMSSLV